MSGSDPLDDVLFDAVLFDLDGTLVATDRFWPDAARAGALRAFAELGLEREPPSAAEWMSMVGLSLDAGFEHVFADLSPEQRGVLMGACLEEEHRALRAGRAAMLPGVAEVLEGLSARGVRTGIASNCSQRYLDAMMGDLGLERWIEGGRCLDSRGVRDKAGMIEDLLLVFGTRSAVMVGDRAGDRDAAWANGLPHVHLARGYAQAGEEVRAEATIEGFDELPAVLANRAAWLDALLLGLELPGGRCVLGVTGGPATGKTFFARDLVRRLERAGRAARVLAVADFLVPGVDVAGLDPARVVEVLRPSSPPGGDTDLEAALAGSDGLPVDGAAEGVTVLEGPGLLHPALAALTDRLVHLALDDELALRRIAGRDARLAGPAPLALARSETLPAQRAFEREYPPVERADLVVDASNPLGPLARDVRPGLH